MGCSGLKSSDQGKGLLSKVLMYEFHYDYIENKYEKKIKTIIYRHW